MSKKRGYDAVDRTTLSPALSTSDSAPNRKVSVATTANASPVRKRRRVYRRCDTNTVILNASYATKRAEHELCLKIESSDQKVQAFKQKGLPPAGNLLAFGTNEFGQLAHKDDVETRSRPSFVVSVHNIGVIQVACGALHNIIITAQGKVLTWGCNDEGSLGKYGIDTARAPVEVKGFLCSNYELAKDDLTEAMYTWSDLKHARGDCKFSDPSVDFDPKYEERVVNIASGDTQCLALSENGRVYSFGSVKDTEGMAWGDVPPKDDPRRYPDYNYVPDENEKEWDWPADPNNFKGSSGKRHWPVHVWQLPGKAIQISCGFASNAAIVEKIEGGRKKVSCFTWGLGQNGELSRPVRKDIKVPKGAFDHLDFDSDEVKIMFAKDPYKNYLIPVVDEDYMVPKEVLWADGSIDRIVEKVVCGGYHLLVIAKDTEDGVSHMYSSGLNNYGQCGHSGSHLDKLTKIDSLKQIIISEVSGGEHFTIVLDSTRTKLFGFGRTCSGQLGYTKDEPAPGSFTFEPVPIYLKYDPHGKPIENPVIARISSGGSHSFALTEDGECYSWGYGVMGQLGVGVKSLDNDCLFLPLKMPATFGVNTLRLKEGQGPVKATIQMVDGGAQHSAMVAKLEEVATLPGEDSIVANNVKQKKERLAAKKREEEEEQQDNDVKRSRIEVE